MKKIDVDIDIPSKVNRDKFGIRAGIYDEENKTYRPHPSGVYRTNVPYDPVSGLCAIPYDLAYKHGFNKIDLLTNTAYDSVKDYDTLHDAINNEPDWSLLEQESVVKQMPQIAKHFELVNKIKPKSLDDLADTLALIRPGKKHMIDEYLINKEGVRRRLYQEPSDGSYYYKKSHAYATALQIVVILNTKIPRPQVEF